jgi:hypothetical protein
LFKELSDQRRLYGQGLNIKDLVERKVRAIETASKADVRGKK